MRGQRVLAVCRDNWIRSRAVEKYLLGKNMDVDSCGVGFLSSVFGKRFSLEMSKDYDIIIAADDKVFNRLVKQGVNPSNILNLEIPNLYWKFIPFRVFRFKPRKYLDEIVPSRLEKHFSFI